MTLELLKKKATDLGIKGILKRGKYTKQNKNELQELIVKAEASGCRILKSVKDLDLPSLENVTCENLVDIRNDFEKKGFHDPSLNPEPKPNNGVNFNGGIVLAGMGLLTILGFGSWYFFPRKTDGSNIFGKEPPPEKYKKFYEQKI